MKISNLHISKAGSFIAKTVAGLALVSGLSACNLMHDDTPPCATDPGLRLRVNFVYDYNTDDVDLFDRQAGSVYLYVFDEEGTFLTRYEKNRVDLDPHNPDFTMEFDVNRDNEFFMGRTYNFVAMAQGSHVGYDGSMETPGFKLVNEMVPHVSTIKDYIIRLNRDDKMFDDFGVVDYSKDYAGTDAMLDSVWSTKPDEVQTHHIPFYKAEFDSPVQLPDSTIEVRIPMMRITNNVTIALASPNFNENTNPKDYDILLYFPKGNGTIDFTGETLEDISQPLYYRALRKYVDVYTPHEGTRDGEADEARGKYAIYAQFGVSRLKYDDESELQIRDPETHEVLARIENFSQYLNDRGNTDYDDPQEYLDREFDFSLDMGLDASDNLWWSQVKIGVLGWAVIDWYIGL